MKFIEKNHYQELVEELQVIVSVKTPFKFTPDQFSRLFEGMQKIDWIQACQIVRDFERLERFPSNIYGVIANRIEDKHNEKRKQVYIQDRWKVSDNEKTSAEEFRLWWAIHDEAKIWISLGLDTYHEEYAHILDLPPAGQACKAWSRIIEYVINNWIAFETKFPLAMPKQREDFLKQILELIQKDRETKMQDKKAA